MPWMSTAPDARAATLGELPRMNQTFPLTVLGDHGLCMGEAWWMDASEICFWVPEPIPGNRELPARVDFRRGTIADLGIRLLDSEAPAKHRGGVVVIGRWTTRSAADGARVADTLRLQNPVAFAPGYRPPRLPAAATSWNGIERRAGAAESRAKLTEEVASARVATERAKSSRWGFAAAGLLLGACAGVPGGLFVGDGFPVRGWLYLADHGWARSGLLAGAALPGFDLGGHDLAGTDLSGARLVGAHLVAAKLAGANLSGADLRRADLSTADLTGANLRGAKLSGANFRGANLAGAALGEAPRDANWRGAVYSADTEWGEAGPPPGALGPGAQNAAVDLRGLAAPGANLASADFTGAWLDGADLHGSDLTGASLAGARGAGLRLDGATLDGLKAEGALLPGVNLTGARAATSTWTGANLSRADLTDAELPAGDFSGASLEAATLTRTKLDAARLGTARFTDADLNRASLVAAEVCGADFSGARLELAALERVSACDSTRWPEGFVPPAAPPATPVATEGEAQVGVAAVP